MTNRKVSLPVLSSLALALGLTAFSLTACGDGGVPPVPGSSGGTDTSGTGGSGTSGTPATGGAPTGGAPTGGAPTGGAPTGGAPTGGAPTGGAPTGGVAGSSTGGATTGGTGGDGMSGAATGGSVTGGTGGSGAGQGGTGGAGGSGNTGGKGGTGGKAGSDNPNSGANTMGWIGCSMGENVAVGYRRIGGTRMWGGYGNGGAVVQSWTSNNSAGWQRFDRQKQMYGNPQAVWMMICVFTSGATIQEIRQMVANAKSHAPGAYLYISGQPVYHQGHVCTLAGDGGPETTDRQAQQIAMEDPDVHYVGPLGPLNAGEYTSDSCHANATGEDKLGRQVKAIWGQP
jgi:hypothetical protein